MSDSKIDIERVKSASVSHEAANIITQLESWFDAKRDSLLSLRKYFSEADVVDLNGEKITDEIKIRWMGIGVAIAIDQLGTLPISQYPSEPEDDDYEVEED